MTKREPGEPDAAREKDHGPDWERGAPEWVPPGRPSGERSPEPGEPARKGDEVGGGPAKTGDPPLEQPFGDRSRHGGTAGRLPEPE